MNALIRIPIWLRIAIIILFIATLVWLLLPTATANIPTTPVQSGEFVIDLKETGKLRAEKSVSITSPPIRLNLQIVDLIAEGTIVNEGDILIQFDTTEINQRIEDQLSEIEMLKSSYERTKASIESNMASMMSTVENSKASYRLSQLRSEQLKFEAEVRQEEGKLNLLQAELSLIQAEQRVEAQKIIDAADLKSQQLKIRQAESDLDKSYKDKERLTVKAPAPGLVVFKETWRGGEVSKIKVGDTPWRGQALIDLPDLSLMQVETTVNEMDVGKVKVGQEVEVRLEAYPDPVFNGKVVEVGALAKSDLGLADVRVFDLIIRIDGENELLKPGMSAKARIIIERIPDVKWIPIEAVFYDDGSTIAWEKGGTGFRKKQISLDKRNDNFVIVSSGLENGMQVALVDPSIQTAKDKKSDSKGDLPASENGTVSSSEITSLSSSGTSPSSRSSQPRRQRTVIIQ